jgi:hypothetical protein
MKAFFLAGILARIYFGVLVVGRIAPPHFEISLLALAGH